LAQNGSYRSPRTNKKKNLFFFSGANAVVEQTYKCEAQQEINPSDPRNSNTSDRLFSINILHITPRLEQEKGRRKDIGS
jgi:hypothetical protein